MTFKDLIKYGYTGEYFSNYDSNIIYEIQLRIGDKELPNNKESVRKNLETAFQEVTGLDIESKGVFIVEDLPEKISPEFYRNKYFPALLDSLLIEEPDYSCIDSIKSIGIALMGMITEEKIFTSREELKELLECKIFQWKERYEPSYLIPDGMPWGLNVNYKDGSVKKYSGSNAFPISWNRIKEIFKNHLGGYIYKFDYDSKTYKKSKFYGYEFEDRCWEYPFIDEEIKPVLEEKEIYKILKIRGKPKTAETEIASRLFENGFEEADAAIKSRNSYSYYDSNIIRKGVLEILIMRLIGNDLNAFHNISCPNCKNRIIAAIGKTDVNSNELTYEKEGNNSLFYDSKYANWKYIQQELKYHCICCGVTFK